MSGTEGLSRALQRKTWQRWRAGFERLRRPMTFGVRGVVIDIHGRIFLVRHTYIAGWYLPGGGVEPRESAEAALARELAEEGNLVLIGRPVLHGLFLNQQGAQSDHVACYIVRSFQQPAPHRPDFEIAETGFFAPGALPAATSRATRARIDEVLSGAPAGDIW